MQIKINLKIFIFLFLFLLTKNIGIYGLIMIFALIHELSHLLCGVLLGFRAKSLSIMPIGFRIHFQINYQEYNKKIKKGNVLTIKKILLALAGPVSNIIIAIIWYIFNIELFGFPSEHVIYANLIIGLFNLIPIYPLDGGRILKNILHIFVGLKDCYKYVNIISNVCIVILTMFSSVLILHYKNVAILVMILYLWFLVIKNNKEYTLKEKIYQALEDESLQSISNKSYTYS